MTGRIFWRLLVVFILIIGMVIGGIAIYRLGYSHGAMTAFALPEGSEEVTAHAWGTYPGWHYGPRVGLLGLLPLLLCFGGFFFMMLLFSCGFAFRRRAWRRCRPEDFRRRWKYDEPSPVKRDTDDSAETPPSSDEEVPSQEDGA